MINYKSVLRTEKSYSVCFVQRRNARLECRHSLCFLEINREFKT
jgi:hypothetical protein